MVCLALEQGLGFQMLRAIRQNTQVSLGLGRSSQIYQSFGWDLLVFLSFFLFFFFCKKAPPLPKQIYSPLPEKYHKKRDRGARVPSSPPFRRNPGVPALRLHRLPEVRGAEVGPGPKMSSEMGPGRRPMKRAVEVAGLFPAWRRREWAFGAGWRLLGFFRRLLVALGS